MFSCCSQNTSEWDSWDAIGRTGSLNSVDYGNGVFVVPHSNEFYREDTLPVSAYFQDSRVFSPDRCLFDPSRSVSQSSNTRRSQTGRGRFSKPNAGVISKGYRDNANVSQILSESGQSATRPHTNGRQAPSFRKDSRDKSGLKLSISQLHDRSYPVLRSPVSQPINDSDADDETDDENGFAPKRPPLPRGYRVPYTPQVYMGPYRHWGSGDPYSFPGDADDVFSPSAHRTTTDRPTLPRHSSMKPSSYQTYLTGDPVTESFGSPFSVKDLSSVHPSFIDRSLDRSADRSHDTLPRLRPQAQTGDFTVIQGFEFPSWESSDNTLQDEGSRLTSRVHFDNSGLTVIERMPDYGSRRGRQVARVIPNQKDGLGKAGYTREHLQGAVDKVRRGPRALRSRSAGRNSAPDLDQSFDRLTPVPPTRVTYLSDSVLPQRTGLSQYSDGGAPMPPQRGLPSRSDNGSPSRVDTDQFIRPHVYENDIEPYKTDKVNSRYSISSSGRGSFSSRMRHSSEPHGFPLEDSTPESGSSGIGSKVTGTGSSLHSRRQRNSVSLLTPHDTSDDSSPFLPDASLRREISGDENYEFDDVREIESDVADILNKYSSLHSVGDELMCALESGLSTSDFYNDLYPKPTRQSRYDNSEARFQKLRQEFHQHQRQVHNQRYVDSYFPAMDSDML